MKQIWSKFVPWYEKMWEGFQIPSITLDYSKIKCDTFYPTLASGVYHDDHPVFGEKLKKKCDTCLSMLEKITIDAANFMKQQDNNQNKNFEAKKKIAFELCKHIEMDKNGWIKIISSGISKDWETIFGFGRGDVYLKRLGLPEKAIEYIGNYIRSLQ